MALTGWGNSNYLHLGSNSSLDDLSEGTIAQWIYVTDDTQRINTDHKGNATRLEIAANAGFINYNMDLSATDAGCAAAKADFAHYGVNKWVFLVVLFHTTTGSNNKLFAGDLTNLAAEPSSYNHQTGGSGAYTNNSASNWEVGNNSSTTNRYFVGSIASHWIFNARLSDQEIHALQFGRRIHYANLVSYHEFGLHGTTSLPDLSRNGNNGTVVGSLSRADHVSLRAPFAWSRGWSPPSAVANTISVGVVSHSYSGVAPKVSASVAPGASAHTYSGVVPVLVHSVPVPQTIHTYSMGTPQVRASVMPGAVAHTYTGVAPQARAQVAPAQVDHTYTAVTPQVRASVAPGAAVHTYSGVAPDISSGLNQVDVPVVNHTYSAVVPKVNASVMPGTADHDYTAEVPTPNLSVLPPDSQHAYVGEVPEAQTSVNVGPAVHTYSATAPDVQQGGVVAAAERRLVRKDASRTVIYRRR